MPAAERAKVATRVESLYRVPYAAGQSLYYVEATKRYGMPPLTADRKAPAPIAEGRLLGDDVRQRLLRRRRRRRDRAARR